MWRRWIEEGLKSSAVWREKAGDRRERVRIPGSPEKKGEQMTLPIRSSSGGARGGNGGSSGLCSTLLLVILALGFAVGSYNFVSIIRSRHGDLEYVDPVIAMPHDRKPKATGKLFHVALTATDSPYSHWQCRIMYYWYKQVKNMEGSDMGGFTRILHSGEEDKLMDEIPTVVVQPLPGGLDRVGFIWFFFNLWWLSRITFICFCFW